MDISGNKGALNAALNVTIVFISSPATEAKHFREAEINYRLVFLFVIRYEFMMLNS